MQEVRDHVTISFWPVIFFWVTAALCYFFGGSPEWTISLLSLGVLTAIARYVMRNDRPS
jgi:hypothetical protein